MKLIPAMVGTPREPVGLGTAGHWGAGVRRSPRLQADTKRGFGDWGAFPRAQSPNSS